MANNKFQLTRAQLCEKMIYLSGKPFSLNDYPHMRAIYNNDNSHEIVLKTSRQVGKSTTLANIMVANSVMIPGFKSMFISPTVDQTKVFSHDRVNPALEGSPFVKSHYMNSSLVQNVFMKQLLNGSRMYLRYALLSADRLRGYSTDAIFYDEAQDLVMDIMPVANMAMSRSMYKWIMYSGTPKTSKGTLGKLWKTSSMNEWMVKCITMGCRKWNVLDAECVGDHGAICRYCGKPLDTTQGEWVMTNEDFEGRMGFKVNILMFDKSPWVDWRRDVIVYREENSEANFYNEVLGLEYDEGVVPVTEADIRACCTGGKMVEPEDYIWTGHTMYGGLDYGPVNSSKSNTLFAAMQVRGGSDPIIHVVYIKKYVGAEAAYAYIHDDVPRLINKLNIKIVGADFGLGEAPTAEIRRRTNFNKVISYQHVPTQKEKMQYNHKLPAYTLNRTAIMTDFFTMIKKKKVVFPRWEDFEPYAKEIMSIHIEYNEEKGTMRYVNDGADDFFHSLIYGGVTAQHAERVLNIH